MFSCCVKSVSNTPPPEPVNSVQTSGNSETNPDSNNIRDNLNMAVTTSKNVDNNDIQDTKEMELKQDIGDIGALMNANIQTANKLVKNSRRYHPLRKLMNGDNPNSLNKSVRNWSPAFVEYLSKYDISGESYFTFATGLSLQADIVTPFSSEYNSARQESDPAFDKFPLMIVYCATVGDVVACIKFAKKHKKVSVNARAGGHSTAGYSVLNGRLVIDVSRMKGIFIDKRKEKNKSTGIVGAGVTWGEFNYELNAFDLHCVGGSCSSVGCTGYTLGGGYGYTSIRWGIACDNLLQVTMVDANGEIIVANEENEHKDLLWACRGGTGGNFGIVCSLKYKLHNMKLVWPILINYDIDKAAKVLEVWQNHYTKTIKDRKIGLLGFLATRAENIQGGTKWVPYFAFRGIYSGDNPQEGREALKLLLDIEHHEVPNYPLFKKRVAYGDVNEHLLDNVEGVIPDIIKEVKRCSIIKKKLTLEQFQRMVDYYKTSPGLYNIVSMEPYGGAITDLKPDATAFVHRDGYFDVFVDSFWMPNQDEKIEQKAHEIAKDWLDDYFESDKMKDIWSEYYYQNYPYQDYKNWEKGYFGTNYPKLRKVKKCYDPQNFFNFPQSIKPE